MSLTIKFRNDNTQICSVLENKWLDATPVEVVRQKFICRLVNEYGYQLAQIEHGTSEDFWENEAQKSNADILIWKSEKEKKENKSPYIVVDCHANTHIKNEDYIDVENYALLEGVTYFVTYYEKDSKEDLQVYKFSEEKPPLQLVRLENFPIADILNENVNSVVAKAQQRSKEELKKIFFSCHDAIRNNDKLSPEMAFDEISKVLFIKIRYEKKNRHNFDKEVFLSLEKDYQTLFNEVKEEYKNDDIFEERDTFRIRKETFLQIIDKLGNV
ncbi:MAG: hypothetical protein RLZZ292_2293, partial [Bacteroidota bacterium]